MINQLTFTKHYDTFDNVSKIYSDKFPQGKDLDLLHIVLYFRFLSYQENNRNCYESHETLAKIFKSSSSTIKRKINDLKEMGLLETSPHPDPYIYWFSRNNHWKLYCFLLLCCYQWVNLFS